MRRGRRITIAFLLLLLPILPGCPGDPGDSASAADTLSRRQKDSLISTMPVPGAGAVGRALDASDALRSRATQHDTLFR